MVTVPYAESGITNLRREMKLVLAAAEAERLARVLALAATPLESRVVAVYFDTPGARLARRAAGTPDDCVKVRTKAYDPDRSDVPGRVVLEVKRERAGVTSKERIWLARREVRGALARALVPVFGRLAPVVATSYRRRVFQCQPGWRVTVDDAIRFHAADWGLFGGDAPPWHGGLAPAFGAEHRVVVELKYTPDGLPDWLAELGEARRVGYSKFAAAAVHATRGRSAGA
jgi:hypothetical protein